MGEAVLDIIREEKLQARALEVGSYAKHLLDGVKARRPKHVGDVRGLGLFLGIEIVENAVRVPPCIPLYTRALIGGIDSRLTMLFFPYLTGGSDALRGHRLFRGQAGQGAGGAGASDGNQLRWVAVYMPMDWG